MKIRCSQILIVLILMIVIAIISIGCNNREESIVISNELLTTEQKLEDFEYLYNLFKENYPFLEVNKRINGVDWLANKKEYIQKIRNTVTDVEFIEVIEEILRDLNNGHVHLINKNDFSFTYVGSTDPINGEWIKPWGEVMKREAVLNRYDYNETEVEKFREEIHKNIDNPSTAPISPAFDTSIIIPDKVAYLHISTMSSTSAEEDGKEMRKFYEKIKTYEKLIIDIRGNSGGSDYYWMQNVIEPLTREPVTVEYYGFARGDYGEPFFKAKGMDFKPINDLDKETINKIPSDVRESFDKYYLFTHTIEPKDSINFEGKIYLLVDNAVYSSSESFAAFCKDSGFATLIGETTGGDGRGINPLYFSLPHSGLLGRFSAVLCLNGDFTINEEVKTLPDVYVNANGPIPLHSYSYDEAVQYVINNKTH